MDILFGLGISDNDLKNMLELVPRIMDMSDEEINNKIDILRYVGCNMKQIKNIVVCNPYYLDELDSDILRLIKELRNIGFKDINLLFDGNPNILNKDSFEIKDYINNKLNDGMILDDIIDEIEGNPYIMDLE